MCASQVQVQEQAKLNAQEFFMKVYEKSKNKIINEIMKRAINERYYDIYINSVAKMMLGMEKGIGFPYKQEEKAKKLIDQGWGTDDISVDCRPSVSTLYCTAYAPNNYYVDFFISLVETHEMKKQEYEQFKKKVEEIRKHVEEKKKVLELENEVKDLKERLEIANRTIDNLKEENERLKSDREKLATIVYNLLFEGKVTREDIIKILQSLDKNAYEEELDRLLGNYVEDNDYEDP